MENTEALKIIRSLAEGIDPRTGEVFPEDSPYQHPGIVRALFIAVKSMEELQEKQKRQKALPENAGKPWTTAEDNELAEAFDKGTPITELAQRCKRTEWAIQSRLEKLGKAVPNPTAIKKTSYAGKGTTMRMEPASYQL